jgi:hypothetical protein
MMRTLRAMVVVVAVLAALPAAAEEEANPKFYGTLGGLAGIDAFEVPQTANVQSSGGLDTRFGY